MTAAHSHNTSESVQRVRAAFVLNLVFTVVEAVGGFMVGSVAIIADAVHDLGDTASLGIALWLEKFAQKGPSSRFSYGYRRVSALSALISGAVLLVGSSFVIAFSVGRLWEPHGGPQGWPMFGIAVFGTLVNGLAAWRLSRGATQNEKVLTWHLLEDVLGWIAVLIGSVLILALGWTWVDPVLAILIGLFVVVNVLRRLRQTLGLFLQEVPPGVNVDRLRDGICALQGVQGVHDIHAWSLDGEHHVLSCHVVIAEEENAEAIKQAVRARANQEAKFHVTVEIELETENCVEDCDQES